MIMKMIPFFWKDFILLFHPFIILFSLFLTPSHSSIHPSSSSCHLNLSILPFTYLIFAATPTTNRDCLRSAWYYRDSFSFLHSIVQFVSVLLHEERKSEKQGEARCGQLSPDLEASWLLIVQRDCVYHAIPYRVVSDEPNEVDVKAVWAMEGLPSLCHLVIKLLHYCREWKGREAARDTSFIQISHLLRRSCLYVCFFAFLFSYALHPSAPSPARLVFLIWTKSLG
ncbi:hypothetical protein BDW69DRAFT_247 [Aspergillus filifer]